MGPLMTGGVLRPKGENDPNGFDIFSCASDFLASYVASCPGGGKNSENDCYREDAASMAERVVHEGGGDDGKA